MPDTMCGFRVYPLTTTIPLLVDRKIGMRMDFDIEVAVRTQWRGTDIVTVPTAVIYPPDGTSNFHMLGDNWLITKLHTRLVIGMLLRLPRLAGRKVPGGGRHWSGIRERGGTFGMRFLFAVYRTFGHRVFLFLLYPVIGYFYLTSPRARKASEEFLDRVAKRRHDLEPQSGSPEQQLRTTSTFRHLLDFGRAVLDKGAVWVGSFPAERIQFDDVSVYERFRAENRGSMFIGSHLGNIELLRGLGESKHDLIVNALVFTRHSEKFNRMLESVSPEASKRMIQVDALGPGSVEKLARRLAAGEHVAMVADRTSVRHRERSVYAEFLGKPAPFPEGPFILAHLLRCPVYLLFCLRIDGAYRIFLEPFSPRLELPRANRREALQAVVERYASRLEHHCLLAPTQWFNFFDFWAQAEDSGKNERSSNSRIGLDG
jgi:predicted LPLAT superfamily acyltransferase